MKNSYTCPACGKEFAWDDETDETLVRCPSCKGEMIAPKALLDKGFRLGDYEVIRRIGVGGMGEIYLADQLSMKRCVALKILHDDIAGDKAYIQRFFHEVRMLAAIEHPGIVRAIEAGYDKGIYFLSMEFVTGSDLKRMLDDGKIFSEADALKIVRELAKTLKYVWDSKGILHRDVKPANIMISEDLEVKLMDLGISKNIKENLELTVPGMMVGSPQYVSPEQAKADKTIDFRADIYSLGATLYHMICGEPPFNRENSVAILAAHLSDPVPDPRKKNRKISLACAELIKKMMAKKRDERFSSWQSLISSIDSMLASMETPVRRSESPGSAASSSSAGRAKSIFLHSKPRIAIFALLLLILLALLINLAIVSAGQERHRKAKNLYDTAEKFIRDNPDPLREIRVKLEMLESAAKAGDPKIAKIAKKRMGEVVEFAKREKSGIEKKQKIESFEEVRQKAYSLQIKGEFRKALDLLTKYRDEGPYSADPELRKLADREIEFIKRKMTKEEGQ